MAGSSCYDSELNLKATELSLALPGSDEPEQRTSTSMSFTSRKRSCTDLSDAQEDKSIAPPSKAQIVGWPPVQSHRKNNLQAKRPGNGNGSGLFVKVNMDGAPFLRKIDLKAQKSYVELVKVLEEMFNVKIGNYSESEGYDHCDYTPSYEDKDGDWMLVGDVPWEMFVSSCKRLRITKCEAKRLCL